MTTTFIEAISLDHSPYVEEIYRTYDCVYGDCDHDGDDECLTRMVACKGCTEAAEPDPETELTSVVQWPCIHTTRHGGLEEELVVRMLAEGETDGAS